MKTLSTLALLSLVVFPACKKDDEDTETDTETDTTPTEEDFTGKFGSIIAVHWPADADYPEGYAGAGFFIDQDGGIVNLAECLLMSGACLASVPAEGATVTESADASFLETAEFYDAGGAISVGGEQWVDGGNYDVPVYEAEPTVFDGMGALAFDGDLAPFEGADAFTYASKLVVTSPSPTERIAAGPGESIDIAWTAGSGTMLLRYGATTKVIADNGSTSVAVADLGLEPPFDARAIRLARATFQNVDAAGNTVRVQTISEQWLYVDYTDTNGWDELAPSNTCSMAQAADAVGAGSYYGDLSTGYSNNLDLGADNELTGYATEGNDAMIKIELAAGEKLTAKVRQLGLDAAIYVVTNCEDASSAVAGADATLTSEFEELEYTASGEQTVYLVIDAYEADEGARWTAEIGIE